METTIFGGVGREQTFFMHVSNDPPTTEESLYIFRFNRVNNLTLYNSEATFIAQQIDMINRSNQSDIIHRRAHLYQLPAQHGLEPE